VRTAFAFQSPRRRRMCSLGRRPSSEWFAHVVRDVNEAELTELACS
jgi:hypothetical protein